MGKATGREACLVVVDGTVTVVVVVVVVVVVGVGMLPATGKLPR